MSADLAAKLLTLLTLAEVWLKMREYDDLAMVHADMASSFDWRSSSIEMDLVKLLNQVKIWRQKKNAEEVARCHVEMRALLEGVTSHG
jgi:hypothetical protein